MKVLCQFHRAVALDEQRGGSRSVDVSQEWVPPFKLDAQGSATGHDDIRILITDNQLPRRQHFAGGDIDSQVNPGSQRDAVGTAVVDRCAAVDVNARRGAPERERVTAEGVVAGAGCVEGQPVERDRVAERDGARCAVGDSNDGRVRRRVAPGAVRPAVFPVAAA